MARKSPLLVKCRISELSVVWPALSSCRLPVPSMDNGQKYSLVQLCVTDTGIDQAGLCDKVIGPTVQIANTKEIHTHKKYTRLP